MEYVAAILLVWTYSSQPTKIDVADMPTCKAMQEQIASENKNDAHLYTRCVGIPG